MVYECTSCLPARNKRGSILLFGAIAVGGCWAISLWSRTVWKYPAANGFISCGKQQLVKEKKIQKREPPVLL